MEKDYSTTVERLNYYRIKYLVRRLLKNKSMGTGVYNYFKQKRQKEKQLILIIK